MVLLFTQPDTDHWKSNRFQVPAPSGSVLFWRNGVGSNVFGGPTLRSDKKPRRKDGLQALTVPTIPLDLTSFISIVRLRRGLALPWRPSGRENPAVPSGRVEIAGWKEDEHENQLFGDRGFRRGVLDAWSGLVWGAVQPALDGTGRDHDGTGQERESCASLRHHAGAESADFVRAGAAVPVEECEYGGARHGGGCAALDRDRRADCFHDVYV